MTTTRDLIESYNSLNAQFEDLTDLQLNELVAEWLLDNCPGNPFDAADFFVDGLANNNELMSPVLLQMAGRPNENYNIADLMAWGLREECKKSVGEYWDEVVNQISREAA